jgi:PAS domain S-box-containing protein
VGLLTESLRRSLQRARRDRASVAAANAELVAQAQRLLASEERFRSVIDLAVDGILIASAEGRVLSANRRLLELTGRTADSLLGLPLAELFPREELLRAPLCFERLERGETVVEERLLLRGDGSVSPVEMSSKRMPDGTYHSFLRDVTERRRAEQERARLQDELRHAQKMEAVGRLAGGIAHDFNNMLMVIGSSVDVALLGQEPGTRVQRCLAEVQRAVGRAGSLTRQLLAFSRKQTVEPRVLDLRELVGNLRPMLAGVLGRGVEIGIELPSRPSFVRVDAGQVEQAILNLAVNARDAMPHGGRFELAVSEVVLDGPNARGLGVQPGRHVALRVSDTGSGMTDDVLRHLFEPFFTTKPAGKGTGLGLAMVYGAVKQSGGAIAVESQPGEGATFQVLLPQAGNAPEPLDAASEGASSVEARS